MLLRSTLLAQGNYPLSGAITLATAATDTSGRSMAAEAAFVGNGSTRHRGLQAGDRAGMALGFVSVLQMGAVLLHQSVELASAGFEYTREIQRDVGRMVFVALAELVRPIPKLLPFVRAFFGNFDRVFTHTSIIWFINRPAFRRLRERYQGL